MEINTKFSSVNLKYFSNNVLKFIRTLVNSNQHLLFSLSFSLQYAIQLVTNDDFTFPCNIL